MLSQRHQKLLEILLDARNRLVPPAREPVGELPASRRQPDRPIFYGEEELLAAALGNDAFRRLAETPGIGLQTATAMVAAIGTCEAFDCKRGLAPHESSQGRKRRLGKIA